jgi:hypothetical protein
MCQRCDGVKEKRERTWSRLPCSVTVWIRRRRGHRTPNLLKLNTGFWRRALFCTCTAKAGAAERRMAAKTAENFMAICMLREDVGMGCKGSKLSDEKRVLKMRLYILPHMLVHRPTLARDNQGLHGHLQGTEWHENTQGSHIQPQHLTSQLLYWISKRKGFSDDHRKRPRDAVNGGSCLRLYVGKTVSSTNRPDDPACAAQVVGIISATACRGDAL